MTRWALFLLFLALACGAVASLPKRVEFVRPPGIVTVGHTVVLQVRVEPHEDNRRLTVAAVEGEIPVRTMDEQLAGDTAARTRWLRFLMPPCDPCLLVGILIGVEGEIARDTASIKVVD